MIKLSLNGANVEIELNKSVNFDKILSLLKTYHCRYNSLTHKWSTNYFRYLDFEDYLSELDVVDNKLNKEEVDKILSGTPEREFEKTRRQIDYSLLNYECIKGKSPNENFQRVGITQGINQSRRLYLWDCGSGKSFVASAIIAHRLYKYKDCGKVLFLTSNIGVQNLYHELFKFIKNLDETRVRMITKDNRNCFDDKNVDILVMSYNTFRLVCDYYKKENKISSKLPKKPFLPLEEWADGQELMLVLDESHNLSTPTSLQTHYMILHSKFFKYRYLFTATFADKPEKMWSQLYICDPYLVWRLSFADWKIRMANIGTRYSQYAISGWKADEIKLENDKILEYGTKYKIDEILDLPDYNEKRIYIPMSKKHREIYESFVVEDLKDKNNSRDIINRFMYMMLSVDNPQMLLNHENNLSEDLINKINTLKITDLNKINAIENIIADNEGEKILIWCIHPSTINIYAEYFKKYKPICIMGETPKEERFKLIEEFKKSDSKLLIANIQVLSTSFTLTEIKTQIYADRSFDYTNYEQSTRRIYRYGQTNNVKTYILMYDKSLDVVLDKNLKNKGKLISNLGNRKIITQDEWRKIFNCQENDNI